MVKGPDGFFINFVAINTSFPAGQFAALGDIFKMFNVVYLKYDDLWFQMFLWRGMKIDK